MSHRSFSSPGWDIQTSLEGLTCSQLGYVIYLILSGWAMLDGAGNHAWNFTPEQIVNLAHVSTNAVLKLNSLYKGHVPKTDPMIDHLHN